METLYLVIPCYNEEEMLPITAEALMKKMDALISDRKISSDSKVMFVDDGSKDKTWEIIEKLHSLNPMFTGLKLSRNKGHQNALLAGLMTAKNYADILISMDADLQDDIGAIDGFLEKRAEGCDIVYGVRSSREKDTAFKRGTAQAYYKLLAKLGVEITYNHADYRLMSRRAVEALSEFKEVNLFLRGLVPMVGFKSDIVTYVRNERQAGESKYPLKKMISFAVEGITSLSVKPIRLITSLGLLVFLVSIIMLIYFFVIWCMGKTVAGWTTTVVSVWALGGLQLLAIGVIGEYIGKIYLETKERPKFIIETNLEETN
ncbi:glycosyltransferase family 2 protein [Ruminococcus sp. Marseille-P6503]|uniref:glycosyltransferase family 2 protein n=1 Tax=Ruminococcus sp. Marseille-P6503 TaxID=2364796 RepID=UPI000F525919|nr:glycosyltransferase family 2 protein [Ruminococcus sp. Marseille-P6503]